MGTETRILLLHHPGSHTSLLLADNPFVSTGNKAHSGQLDLEVFIMIGILSLIDQNVIKIAHASLDCSIDLVCIRVCASELSSF